MKNRQISGLFLSELKKGAFKPIVDFVRTDPSLDLEMRGNSVIIYYRGGKILSIQDPQKTISPTINADSFLKALDSKYLNCKAGVLYKEPLPLSIISIESYFAKAKHIIDRYEETVKHKLGEKEIQQRVVSENNYSVNSDQSDFFIADMEWEDNSALKGRADIIAFYWGHMNHRQKKLKMFVIEVKQGHNAIKTNKPNTNKESPGLLKHFHDFEVFKRNTEAVSFTKSDMLKVLCQKTELGLVLGLDSLFKRMEDGRLSTDGIEIEKDVEFVFLLANYLHFSDQLKNELTYLDDKCKFFCSCFMGYGLYIDFIIEKKTIFNYPKIFKNN